MATVAQNVDVSWLDKIPEFKQLSADDKKSTREIVQRLSPAQRAAMAEPYGVYLGVYKPFDQWDANDIVKMYAQATGKSDITEAKNEFIKQYGHGFNNWLKESGQPKAGKTVWGTGTAAFNAAVRNFKSLQQGNNDPRLVRTAEGWYDTVTGKAHNQEGAKAGYTPNATGFSIPYSTNMPIPATLQADIKEYTTYAPEVSFEEASTPVASPTKSPLASTVQLPAGTDRTTMDTQVRDYYQRYLNREPTRQELNQWVTPLAKGDNIGTQISNLPEASTAGTRPTYGLGLGGITNPQAPNISGIAQPNIPKLTNYGQTVNGQSMPVYGAPTQGGLGLAQYGDKIGGYAPVNYGDNIAGLGLVKTGDTVGGVSPVKYGDEIGGVNSVQYGSNVGGLTPAKYGETLGDISFQRYGSTIAGQDIPDYNALVSKPVEDWRFTNTDAYNAKNVQMNQTLQNQLAARGSLRGAPAVNMITDQSRKLYSEEYDKERAWFVTQRTAEYQAKGLSYSDAYTAASNEYNNAYGARTAAYNTALQAETDRYNTALTTEQQRYQNALTNAQGQYTLAYNAKTGQYETVLKNAQEQYGLGYGSDLSNYGAAVNSANTNAGETYNMQTGQYGQKVNNALTDYNLGTERYDKAYNAAMSQATAAYNELLDAAKLGQSSAAATAQAGSNTANAGSASIQQQGSAAATNAINKGQAEAGLWQGLGNVVPSGLSMYGNISSLAGSSGLGTSTGGSTNYLGNFSSDNYTLGSGTGRSVSPFSKGLGAVPTTLPKTKTKTYDPNQSYGFNA